MAKRQTRFVKNENHRISKELVTSAKASNKALALENLKGIKERVNGLGKEMRWQMGNWAFAELASFVVYKAKKVGVVVHFVDPRNTSRTCSACGHCDKANRKSQPHFKCLSCNHELNADYNAAINIANRAAVNWPIVSSLAA